MNHINNSSKNEHYLPCILLHFPLNNIPKTEGINCIFVLDLNLIDIPLKNNTHVRKE